MGIVSQRRKQQRMRQIRRRLTIVLVAVLLGAAAASDGLREKLAGMMRQSEKLAQAFAGGQSAEVELTLPETAVYALQLGVFDSGERAASETQRLERDGVRCMVFQREKMRIISSVALSRDALDFDGAKGHEAYVIGDTLPEVSVRVTAAANALEDVCALLSLPDRLLAELLNVQGDTLAALLQNTKASAQPAQHAHLENELYTQLAQSLMNWCSLMEQVSGELTQQQARSYAQVTIYALCYELRAAINCQMSAESTASAQRTPSTAADVMPPA